MAVKIEQTVCWSWSLLCRVRWKNGLLLTHCLQQVKIGPMEENEYSWARLHFPVFEQIFFCEIQESVGFLRNPQDFKNSCRKMKKMFLFLRLKNGFVFDP